MIDAHCHIHYNNYEEIFKKAKEKQLFKLLNIHMIEENENKDFEIMLNFAKKNNSEDCQILLGAGVHPLGVEKINTNKAEEILKSIANNIITFGETGLDLFKAENKSEQLDFLTLHCALAKKYNKPVVIHSRNCDIKDILNITEEFNVKTMFHCWTFGEAETEIVLESNNTVLSFSGIITFDKTKNIEKSAILCPINRMFIETDSPFLAPIPFRGKPNEPSFIFEIYKYVALVKNQNIEDFIEQIEHNFDSFFNLI